MKKDIREKIKKDFSNPKEILDMLSDMAKKDDEVTSDRIYRAVVFLADGSLQSLNHFIELYFIDYRDLLWQAEYEDSEIQKYDFNKSFKDLGFL